MSGYLSASIPGKTRPLVDFGFPAIAITRQTGSRASSIGRLLVSGFQECNSPETPPWTLFGDELIQHVLRENNLPKELARYFPEEGTHSWRDTVEEIVGLHPSSFEINQYCHDMIEKLFRLGHVVVIGRCCNMLTKGLPNVLRIRLVGSMDKRVEHIAKQKKLSESEAASYVRREDVLRIKYAKENFNVSNIDDPQLYDLVINTDYLADSLVADTIRRLLNSKAVKRELMFH